MAAEAAPADAPKPWRARSSETHDDVGTLRSAQAAVAGKRPTATTMSFMLAPR